MTTILLKRSGGLLGKTLQASEHIDIDEQKIIEELKSLAPTKNREMRDNFNYSITINETNTFPIDITLLKGFLKKIVGKLEANLKSN